MAGVKGRSGRKASALNTPVSFRCNHCGRWSKSRRGILTPKYCSSKCKAGSQRKAPLPAETCRECGNEFRPERSGRKVFCSKACQSSSYQENPPGGQSLRYNQWKGCKSKFRAPKHLRKRVYCSSACMYRHRWSRTPEQPRKIFTTCPRALRITALLGSDREPINARLVFERDQWTCGICRKPISRTLKSPDPRSVSIDHILPLSHGGPHTYSNVQAAHLGCNIWKSNVLPAQLPMHPGVSHG